MSRIRNAIKQDKMFVNNAIVRVPRSTFNRNQKHSTTFNAGKLVPISVQEVVPGDTFDTSLSSVIRTTSPFIKAPMDELHFDAYAFFVPSRIVFTPFTDMIANYHEDPDWTLDTDIICPEIWYEMAAEKARSQDEYIDSIADHMGIPPMEDNVLTSKTLKHINHIPFRAYCKIWNEWFRDENLQNTIFIDKDNYTSTTFAPTSESYITGAINGGQMLPLNKIKDYFTSALPAPQAGAAPTIAIGGTAPVSLSGYAEGLSSVDIPDIYLKAGSEVMSLGGSVYLNTSSGATAGNKTAFLQRFGSPSKLAFKSDEGGSFSPSGTVADINHANLYTPGATYSSDIVVDKFDNVQAVADLTQTTGISVNDLRYLIQIQQIKETDARYGRRYKEYLLGHFGVVSADARLQIPEFLGHVGYDLNINQTVQTSGTLVNESNDTYSTAQSNISSYSLTSGSGRICNKSFTEHGYVIIVGGVRIKHRTYSQGINRMWLRNSRFDYYDPCLANIGEQPVYDREIYLDNSTLDSVFGYQEAWADYRYLPNITSGYQRPQVSQTLAYWNFADNYTSQPTLSSAWIEEDITPIDRCLAITSAVVPQFTADFYIKNKAIRPMPVHSIPGLLDHSGKIII